MCPYTIASKMREYDIDYVMYTIQDFYSKTDLELVKENLKHEIRGIEDIIIISDECSLEARSPYEVKGKFFLT